MEVENVSRTATWDSAHPRETAQLGECTKVFKRRIRH